jgi:hypothetical protein
MINIWSKICLLARVNDSVIPIYFKISCCAQNIYGFIIYFYKKEKNLILLIYLNPVQITWRLVFISILTKFSISKYCFYLNLTVAHHEYINFREKRKKKESHGDHLLECKKTWEYVLAKHVIMKWRKSCPFKACNYVSCLTRSCLSIRQSYILLWTEHCTSLSVIVFRRQVF